MEIRRFAREVVVSTIRERERELYDDIFSSVDQYAEYSPGEQYLPLFLAMAGLQDTVRLGTVLDAGCGSGKGAVALARHGFDVRMCDLTDAGLVPEATDIPFHRACLWQDLRTALGYLYGGKVDWVYASDVLEHIPTAFSMLVVSRLLEVARRGVFLTISTVPDQFGVFVGRPLHQTVESYVWWHEQLAEIGRVYEARDLLNAGVFMMEPR